MVNILALVGSSIGSISSSGCSSSSCSCGCSSDSSSSSRSGSYRYHIAGRIGGGYRSYKDSVSFGGRTNTSGVVLVVLLLLVIR